MQAQPTADARHYSGTYVEARVAFLDAAARRGAVIDSLRLPQLAEALDQELTTDVVQIGAKDAKKILLVTSGTHGPEGFCGSGGQIATLNDEGLLARLEQAGVALLPVHAVNPHRFSLLHRTNVDNLELNRKHVDFDAPRPVNTDCVDVAKYGGAPSLSTRTMRAILRKYAASATHLGWVDIHTGLNLYGDGEEIGAGPYAPANGEVLTCLSADICLRRYPEVPEAQKHEIRQQLRGAFCYDNDEWKDVVLRQTRDVLLRTLQGLESS
jgi:hypothetical protein